MKNRVLPEIFGLGRVGYPLSNGYGHPYSPSLTLSLPLLSPHCHFLSLRALQSPPLLTVTISVEDNDFYSGDEDDDEDGETTNTFAFDSDGDVDVVDYKFINNVSDDSDDVVSHRY